jgi:pimeloyl-ACP methyl ester carboxylesterase
MPHASIDGLRIHYRETGEGTPVVLVHGWPTDSRLWDRQIPVLAARHRVIAPDLPGFGESDPPASGRTGLDLLQRSLLGLLAATGIERASFVGHDLGGPAVLLTAIRNPDRVERLVVMDTTPYPRLPLLIRLLLWGARIPGTGALMTSRWGFRSMLRLGTANRASDTAGLADTFRPERRAGRRALVDVLRRTDFRDLEEVATGLGDIGAPTLVLWAEHDPTGPVSVAERLAADIPGSLLETVPECGHFLPIDRPEAIADALARFLA